jgi:Calcineurin-like phosphoesterase
MAFHFIHTGDWHLAKPFGRFDGEKAPLLRDARARIVDKVGELARSAGATAVLVAGDVFDGPLVADNVLRKLAVRLEQYGDLEWHFLPGNHDPSTPNGVWQRFARFSPGRHVVIHQSAELCNLDDGVELLSAPLHARAIAHDPTAWMVDREGANGAIRIGLAHGAVQGFGSAGEASVLIAPDRAVSARLDYLALGDWHGVRQVGPKAWYAGTPEPDQFPENEPGYALSVRIAGVGAEPQVERHWLGQYRWERHVLTADLAAGLEALEGRVSNGDGDGANMLMQIQLSGRVDLEDEINLRSQIERLGDMTFHTEADFSGLEIDTGSLAVSALADPMLAAVSERLAVRMAAEGEAGEVAHRALILLTGFARGREDAA